MIKWIHSRVVPGRGSVAKKVEQWTRNPKVVGSNRTFATEFFNGHDLSVFEFISLLVIVL